MRFSVAFIIFNRPETTANVFEQIRKAKPPKLFVIADGPRRDKPDENEKCLSARKITENVDWDCEVSRNYSDVNLGCKNRISSGLTWLFENTEEAIILEDDCFPEPSFFQYCEILLEKYRNEESVMLISGDKLLPELDAGEYSYYFSFFNHIWGWASWRRVWQKYDVEIKDWPELKNTDLLLKVTNNKASVKYWQTIYQEVFDGKIDTWDYQLLLNCWKNNGLTIIPGVNLVSNIGFGKDSTHTAEDEHFAARLPVEKMEFPLKHPSVVERNLKNDLIETRRFHRFAMREKLVRAAKKILGRY